MARSRNPNLKKANQETEFTYDQLMELKRCAQDPVHFIRNYIKIQHPKLGAIKFNLYDYQEEMIRSFQEHRNTIILSARQTGKSETSAAYLLWFAIFHDDKTVLIASNKNTNAMRMIERIKYAYENLPGWLKPGIKEDTFNKHELGFDNNSKIVSEATSENSGRGLSIALLYLDEFAFVPPVIQDEFWTSITPTLSTGGSCIISSTPNGDTNLFAQLWRTAELNPEVFFPIFVAWDKPPGRDEKFRQENIAKLGELKWRQEYLCEFLSSDALLISSQVLQKFTEALKNTKPLFEIRGVKFWDNISAGKTYIVGVDPATGSGGDYSVITVFEFPSMVQVAEYRSNTTSTNDLYEILKNTLNYIQKRDGFVYWSSENNGVGEGVMSLFEADDDQPDVEFVSESGRNKRGMTTVSKTKMKACVNLKEMIEKGHLLIKSMTLLKELKNFVRRKGSYAAQVGSTDDCVSACLIVIRLVEEIASYDQQAFDKLYAGGTHVEEWTDEDLTTYSPDDDPMPFIS